jgi:hypothetical protein
LDPARDEGVEGGDPAAWGRGLRAACQGRPP